MSASNEILERIERYSKGRMGLEERIVFEKELAKDQALQEQLELSEIVDQMVIGAEAWQLKEQMRKDLYKPKPKTGIYLAVSLLVILAGGAGLYYVTSQKEHQLETANVPAKPITVPKIEAPKGAHSTLADIPKPASKSTNSPAIIVGNAPVFVPVAEPMQGSTAPQAPISEVDKPALQAVVPETTPMEQKKVDLCASFKGEVEFYTVASCQGKETGEVHVNAASVKGGKAPFVFVLGDRVSNSHFERLPSGNYSLLVKDATGCVVEHPKLVVIGEKVCKEYKEYMFNLEYDHAWTIPYDSDKHATSFRIMDKGGKIVFHTNVSAQHLTEWRGESNTEAALGMGMYFFAIEYSDGSVDEGSVVVSR